MLTFPSVLGKYVDKLKKKVQDSSYQVVYSLGGYIGKNLKFLLVRDINLEEAKSKFEKIISLHIYSIQKGKLEKFGVLYNSNITEIKKSIQQCSGQAAIQCPAAKLKSPAELASSNVTEVQKNPEPVKPPPSTLKKEETSLDSTSLKTEDAEHTTQGKATAKEKTSSKLPATKGGKPAIAAFFATQQAIGRVNPVKEPAEKKVVDEEPKKSVTHKRLIRQSSDDESENENKDTNSEKVKPTKRFKLAEEPLKSHETKAKAKKSQKKAKQSKLSGKTQRKRIQQISDSESNSDGNYLFSTVVVRKINTFIHCFNFNRGRRSYSFQS
jgi:DNA polymerase delta subunit 3